MTRESWVTSKMTLVNVMMPMMPLPTPTSSHSSSAILAAMAKPASPTAAWFRLGPAGTGAGTAWSMVGVSWHLLICRLFAQQVLLIPLLGSWIGVEIGAGDTNVVMNRWKKHFEWCLWSLLYWNFMLMNRYHVGSKWLSTRVKLGKMRRRADILDLATPAKIWSATIFLKLYIATARWPLSLRCSNEGSQLLQNKETKWEWGQCR